MENFNELTAFVTRVISVNYSKEFGVVRKDVQRAMHMPRKSGVCTKNHTKVFV